MLAVLAIAPAQLIQINSTVTHEQWQLSGYLLLVTAIGLYVLQRYIYLAKSRWILGGITGRQTKSNACAQATSNTAIKSPQPIITVLPQTPLNLLHQQGVLKLLLLLLSVCLFWLSVVCHGLSQRMQMIEEAPSTIRYVEATVTPIGLSDKRIEIGQIKGESESLSTHQNNTLVTTSNKNAQTTKSEMKQGYRQLVELSDVKPYGTQLLSHMSSRSSQNSPKASGQNNRTDNPFSIEQSSKQHNASKLNQSTTHTSQNITVLLQAYQKDDEWINGLSPDKSVRLILKLNPLEFKENLKPQEFDEYRWLSSRHAVATANIVTSYSKLSAPKLEPLNKLTLTQKVNQYRYQLRQHFLSLIQKRKIEQSISADFVNQGLVDDSVAVTLSLLTGDRSLISTDMTAAYRFAGISHLLAISGTHVLFLALLSAALMTYLISKFAPNVYRQIPRWQCAFGVAVTVSFMYAVFAGFDVPAVRTAFMLLIVGVLRYLLVPSAIFKVLLGLAVMMAWQDIFVLWQAGFWLSFIAVAMLVVYSKRWRVARRDGLDEAKSKTESNFIQNAKYQAVELLKIQFWISIALLPISLWLFGEVSLWGFVVNIFAIGLFGWIIVPLNLLAGVIYTLSPWLADYIWQGLFWILERFHHLIWWLSSSAANIGWLRTEMTVLMMSLILLAALPWMLPKRLLNRLLSVPAVLIAVILCLTGFNGQDRHSYDSGVFITELTTQNVRYTALLTEFMGERKKGKWLVLSAQPIHYQTARTESVSVQITKFANHLYQQLDSKGVGDITGIIVQTSNPELSQLVAKLRHQIPFLYYWQAGLSEHQKEVEMSLSGSRLTAQNCQAGKTWRYGSLAKSDIAQTDAGHDKFDDHGLTVVTGWSAAADVSDCAIQVISSNPIQTSFISGGATALHLNRSNSNAHTDSLTDDITLEGSHRLVNRQGKEDLQKKDSQIKDKQSSAYSSAIIYTSHQPKLLSLWQLLCLSAEEGDPYEYTSQHWITSNQAYFDKKLVDTLKPRTWHMMQGDRANAAKIESLDTHLYWKQNHTNNHNNLPNEAP